MTNISGHFNDLFRPEHLLVFYRNDRKDLPQCYVEFFPLDPEGRPLAPHPLSETEAQQLAKLMQGPEGPRPKNHFLQAESLLPPNVLYTGHTPEPFVVWFTPSTVAPLLYHKSLGIPDGPAAVPPLIWKAKAGSLSVYACREDERPTMATRLYHAPFFNLYQSGEVCMGTVRVSIPSDCSLERFMSLWQAYFFGSYFAHLLVDRSPVEGNIVELWQGLAGSGQPFPLLKLRSCSVTLKQLTA